MMQWTWEWKYVFEILISVIWDKNPEVELLDHRVAQYFHFLRNLCTVLHSGCAILHFHQQCARISVFLQPHQHFFVCLLTSCYFYNDHPNRCEVIGHYGFVFFPHDLWLWASFYVLFHISVFYISFGEISVQTLCTCLIMQLCFLFCYWILEVSSLFWTITPEIFVANSKCFFLFTPLIILFTVQFLVWCNHTCL